MDPSPSSGAPAGETSTSPAGAVLGTLSCIKCGEPLAIVLEAPNHCVRGGQHQFRTSLASRPNVPLG